jgi:tetratricopeptide (TPR) repeat protein
LRIAADRERHGMSVSLAHVRQMISAGWAFMRAGNSNGALREFKSALAVDPENQEALVGLCQSYLDLGDLAAAAEHADALLRLAPELASARRVKAEIYRRRRRRTEALEFAERAVKLEPDEPVGYHILALVHYDRRDYRSALKTLDEGRKIAPGYAVLAAQKALVVLQMRGGRAAEPIANEALRLDLDHEYVLTIGARVALARGQLEKARELLASVLRRNANDEEAVSLYLLTDPGRYRLLRAHMQFPYWRKEHGLLGWAGWAGAWTLFLIVAIAIVLGTHVPGIAVGLGYRFFWQAQYAGHRKAVKKHFAQPTLKGGF